MSIGEELNNKGFMIGGLVKMGVLNKINKIIFWFLGVDSFC